MEFILNLNLRINKSDYLIDCFELTSESKILLSLLDYCRLVSNKEFKCNCYYSKSNLPSKYAEINLHDLLVNKYNDLCIEFIELNENNINEINDTNLPCLKRNVTDQCTINITGLTSLFRDIIKIAHRLRPNLNLIDLLGWRQNCVKACSEASKWTYLCEVMSINTYENINDSNVNDLLDNYFKKIQEARLTARSPLSLHNQNRKTILTKTNPRFLEDFQIQITDLIVFFYVSLILNKVNNFNKVDLEVKYSIVCEWYNNMKLDDKVQKCFLKYVKPADNFDIKHQERNNTVINEAKNDKIQNTEEIIPENDIHKLIETIQVYIKDKFSIDIPISIDKSNEYEYEEINLDWSNHNEQINPSSGGLPLKRIERKCQQLENFLHVFNTQIYPKYKQNKQNNNYSLTLVDFCSGGGHLGILLAYMYPDCLIKLVENKEESLKCAIERITSLNLSNCLLYKGNLNNFTGKFNVGMAIHACGSSTDLIIEKCIQSNADLLISPCCYGSIKQNDLIKYPRSIAFKQALTTNAQNHNYFKLTTYADKTELNITHEKTAYMCMSIVDSDRLLYLKQDANYSNVQLSKLKPENCTTKNNLILAIV